MLYVGELVPICLYLGNSNLRQREGLACLKKKLPGITVIIGNL